ncbi:hypothetical protein [Pseudoxanthomonas sacheonensis]|uniref:Uncharacterized protein n=1 Tax=Pseudoxanthomonas sacheonensis TaxID=443615 RepID=A0ABU1RNX4_9GAMM|nr:hypothetical protein [Pseudoxanthomonas sacheonensis]MDR6840474.1 hypothetical protein [Pseudoxanthomonas sacheonensis]
MKFFALIALMALSGPVWSETGLGPDYAVAKTLADQDEASLAPAESASLRELQGKLLGEAVAACATPTPDLSPFVVVMELGPDGKVVRTWLEGSSLLGMCFRKYVAGRTLIVPSRVPFYTSIELSFSK